MAKKTVKVEPKVEAKAEQPAAAPVVDVPALNSLIKPKRMIRLRGSEKTFALEQLVSTASRALGLDAGQQLDLSAAVQAREAALNTQLGPGWAAPHATLDGLNEMLLIVGRSRGGIDYGRPELGRAHVIFLFVTSPQMHDQYLKTLAQLASAFKEEDRAERIERASRADTPYKLRYALGDVTRKPRLVVSRRLPQVTRALIRNLLRFADEIEAEAIVLFADVFRNPSLLASFVNRKIVLATRAMDVPESLAERARGVVRLARGDFSEESAVQLALLSAGSRDLLGQGSRVVAVCGKKGSDTFDTVRIETPRDVIARIYSKTGKDSVAPEVFERAVQLLVELAEEGREGKSVGTCLIIGDEETVRPMTQQLTINPFHGYDEQERNLLDPALEETVKEFAGLDGAFVVSRAGVILSAATYLTPPAEIRVDLMSGLGARHRVAAAMTKATKAIALVLSQSTGRVTVFKGGKQVLAVSPQRGRTESASENEES